MLICKTVNFYLELKYNSGRIINYLKSFVLVFSNGRFLALVCHVSSCAAVVSMNRTPECQISCAVPSRCFSRFVKCFKYPLKVKSSFRLVLLLFFLAPPLSLTKLYLIFPTIIFDNTISKKKEEKEAKREKRKRKERIGKVDNL